MPPQDDSSVSTELYRVLRDVSEQLGRVRQEVKEDMAQLLRGYREDVHRTTMGIHARLVSYEDTLIADRSEREKRQQVIDAQLAAIRRNQLIWIRIGVALGLIAAGAGIAALVIWWL